MRIRAERSMPAEPMLMRRWMSKMRFTWAVLCVAILAVAWLPALRAETVQAGSKDYVVKVGQLKPGDTLVLEAGVYADLLRLVGLHGRPGEPITITGPEKPLEAVFVGMRGTNTLELADASWLVVKKLTFDGKNIADDAIKANDGQRRPVHHITLEDNTIRNHGNLQAFVGINAQAPCWDWVIRGNTILGAGTGIYLGTSDGVCPFVHGLIEYNLIQNPKGYCLQIKHQNARPDIEGMPTAPTATIIRYNIFAKDAVVGEIGPRPNVLLDGFPDDGPGSRDRYHVYGNVFFSNPREALFQGTGRISFHDNVLVSSKLAAVSIQPHSGKNPRSIRIYHNTVLTDGEAIQVSGAADNAEVVVAGNLLASAMVRGGARLRLGSNIILGMGQSGLVFASLSSMADKLDLQPRERVAAPFPAAVRALFTDEIDSGIDLVRTRKRDWDYCGAFSEPYAEPASILSLAGPDAMGHR